MKAGPSQLEGINNGYCRSDLAEQRSSVALLLRRLVKSGRTKCRAFYAQRRHPNARTVQRVSTLRVIAIEPALFDHW